MREVKKEHLIGIIIALAIILAGYFNYMEAKISKIKELDVKIKEADKKIMEARRIAGLVETKRRELENLQSEYSKLESKIPKTTKWDEVLRELVDLTRKSGLKMISVRFESESEITLMGNSTEPKGETKKEDKKTQKEAKSEKVFSRRINVDLKGRYSAFDAFVKNLTTSSILFSPYSIRVSSSANSRDPELSINLSISMFRYQFGNETVKEAIKQ